MNATSWKEGDWANSSEVNSQPEPTNDTALAQVFDVYAAEISTRLPDDWFIDSGASAHVTGDRNLISNIRSTH
jgi:hypothetical protein